MEDAEIQFSCISFFSPHFMHFSHYQKVSHFNYQVLNWAINSNSHHSEPSWNLQIISKILLKTSWQIPHSTNFKCLPHISHYCRGWRYRSEDQSIPVSKINRVKENSEPNIWKCENLVQILPNLYLLFLTINITRFIRSRICWNFWLSLSNKYMHNL